ncbi:hypothetical protein [Bradyrhizobium sp.]|uniref:hypothetical protein n=1 Tax=Bradyrhizobium sp. TaxID=376 RepID=UPI003C435411
MASDDRANDKTDEDVAADAKPACLKPACVALVPTIEPSCSRPPTRLSRPDPSFVTHLIATAEHLPQTRVHRRATSADALTAYRAGQRKVLDAGLSTRQTA